MTDRDAPRPPPYSPPEPVGGTADEFSGGVDDLAANLARRIGSAENLVHFLDAAADGGVFVWDLRVRNRVWVSDRFRGLLGFDPSVASAWVLWDRVDPDQADRAREAFEAHLADPDRPYDVEIRYRHRSGDWVWFRSRGLVLRDTDGRPDLFVCFNSDITALVGASVGAERSLQALSEFTRSLQVLDRVTADLQLVATPDGILDSLADLIVAEFADLCLLTREAPDGRVEVVRARDGDGDAAEWLLAGFDRLGRTSGALPRLRAAMDDGETILVTEGPSRAFAGHIGLDLPDDVPAANPISVLVVPWARLSDARGGVVVIRRLDGREPFDEPDQLLIQQLVDRHADAYLARMEQAESTRAERFRELAAGAPFGLLHLDDAGRCTFANATWASLVELGDRDPEGDGWASTLGPATRSRLLGRWATMGPDDGALPDGVWVGTRTGSRRWLSFAATPQFDDHGRRTGTIVMALDDTSRRAAEERLERTANRDPLTGAANRRRLFASLDESLRSLTRERSIAVVFVDLDYFKEVNDALGHDAGDRLLVEVARRLRLAARPGELVARVGGDEFVMVLEVADHDTARARVDALMGSLGDRVESGGLRLAINVSMGLVTVGVDESGLTADEVVQRADAAMYVAKASGRNRWAAYDDDMRRRDRRRVEVWQLLEDSLREDRVAVMFQPVVDLATGRVVGAEALARIRDTLPALLTPDAFLEVAEETGLIVPLGEVVVAEACVRLGEWTRIDPDFVVMVNLSGRQLAHPDAARTILQSLRAAGVDPRRLCVEITESVLIQVVGDLAESVQELRRAGVRLALDDFGTGYSSLSRIRDFPIDVVKVDRSFVLGAADDPVDAAIVAAVVQLARSLDLMVVAEGIESRSQLEAVRQLGCTRGQGFHFGAPVDAAALSALVGTAFVADP